MLIRRLELNNVRRFAKLTLDMPKPIAIVAGPNGSGKSTIQKAILAALFFATKKDRDVLTSRFDPHSPPQATLSFTCGDGRPIVLLRRLSDDAGEWREGDLTVKKKGEALSRVQNLLPICADAAGALLCGHQEDLGAIVTAFPADGHSLLTAAAIRGTGPDPKRIVEKLGKDFESAKKGVKGGKEVGDLMNAQFAVERLKAELASASQAHQALKSLQTSYEQAKADRDEIQRRRDELEKEGKQLADLSKKLGIAQKAADSLKKLEEQQSSWEGLEEAIRQAARALADMEAEIAQLASHFRVALDGEWAVRTERLEQRLRRVEAIDAARQELKDRLGERKRPTPTDSDALAAQAKAIQNAHLTLEANGVRYEVSISSGSRTVEIAEEGAPAREIKLQAGQPHGGMVGRVVLTVDDLRVSSAGKADVADVKRKREESEKNLASLLEKFSASSREEFDNLCDETRKLNEELKAKDSERAIELASTTLDGLKDELKTCRKNRRDNAIAAEDRTACKDRVLPTSDAIAKQLEKKKGIAEESQRNLRKQEAGRPSAEQQKELKDKIKAQRELVQQSAEAFALADPLGRGPSGVALAPLDAEVEAKRVEFGKLNNAWKDAETKIATLANELRHAGPERPAAVIEAELADASAVHRREEAKQKARQLLWERIDQKIGELSAGVPIELAAKVGGYLSRITNGYLDAVVLGDRLGVANLRETGTSPQNWQPDDCSTGERQQTALAVKIALARGLADTGGSMFLILDDYLVHFDPRRRKATEDLLLDLTADNKLQVILLTCHADWAAAWAASAADRISFTNLPESATYYRPLGDR